MGVPANANPLLLASQDTGYRVSRSLRFNSADSAYLSRTPASAGNRRTWTWAAWVKRNQLGVFARLFVAGTGTTDATFNQLTFTSADILSFEGTGTGWRKTTAVYRDPGAWMHICLAVDTTLATASERVRLYVNGAEVTTFSTSNNPTQNYDYAVNNNVEHNIGADKYNNAYSYYSNFMLADVHLIDGQQLAPSAFGEFDATTGVWNPKAYTGSYGTNGFHLEFADNSAATATTLGKDTSGNGNNFTPSNLSVTAGAGNDSLVDVPTNYGTDAGAGGEVRGNYCTWNPLSAPSFATLTNGNLDVAINGSSSFATGVKGTVGIPSSGKWYWEVTVTSVGELSIGVVDNQTGVRSKYYRYDTGGWQNIYINDVQTAAVAGFTTNDIIGVGYDADNSQIRWYKNGTQVGTNYSLANNGRFLPFIEHGSGSGSASAVANFGQRPFAFAYTAPSGFKALCTQNLPTPTVVKPSTVFDTKTWSGNGGTQTISGLGFSPDLVWIKCRSAAYGHLLADTVRGIDKSLYSNATSAEDAFKQFGYVSTSSTADFTVVAGSSDATVVNGSSQTYVGWTWDAGSSTVTNTSGSISSQVRANASAGFSVVTYTGTGTTGTVGHGLGVVPSMMIVKRRDAVANWYVYHSAIGNTGALGLNLTNATITSANFWNNTSPTSTVLTVSAGSAEMNTNGGTYVVYAFAPVSGYSSFGSITSNGTSDNAFAYLGFRPRFLLYKNASATGNWGMYDSSRDPENVCDNLLLASSSSAEFTSVEFDFLSNGIKLRYPYTNGNQIVFAAFAESPFNYARAR
jgi:hypothetical protein